MRKSIHERFNKIEQTMQPVIGPVLLIVHAPETKEEVAKRIGFDLNSDAPRLIINHPE